MLLASLAVAPSYSQRNQTLPSLKTVAVPAPPNLSTYVRDTATLVVLGKALFWDIQVGSDGKVACATCHFHAGADHRIHNQLSNPQGTVQPNYRLTAADFPFRKLADPGNAASAVMRDSTQRAGSAGMFTRMFTGIVPGIPSDDGDDAVDTTFHAGSLNLRQVGGRNAPSVINAVHNFRNFWDGRASNTFTGITPFGLSDTRPNVLSSAAGDLKLESVRIENSSLASQAVGPVLSAAEMSYNSRNWPAVGKKMLALRPLAYQRIAPDDSVLGPFANTPGAGFKGSVTYLDLIKTVFQPAYWDSAQLVDGSGVRLSAANPQPPSNQFSQAEFNFALFFGLAVQAYESTLVSDDSRFDRFADGQAGALNNTELTGMQLFTGRTGCIACHKGAELTLASYSGVNGIDPLKSGPDTGYFHVGVRPIQEDSGLGGRDGLGNLLSSTFPADTSSPASAHGRFKTPGLRNVELTGPYFHNGGQATLEQVMEFYNRGGDFPTNASKGPNVRRLSLSAKDQTDVVAFLKALTDDRVRFERAPFDHPELCVPDGHVKVDGSPALQPDGNPMFPLTAADRWAGIPPVGRNGNLVPLQTFEELLSGIGVDGSRAHNLNDPCAIDALTSTGFASYNAATFGTASRTRLLAQDSTVAAVGVNFARTTESASPATTTLAGISVSVEDSTRVSRVAPLTFVSPARINFVVPPGTALGTASIKISGGPVSFFAPVRIVAVSPGLFNVGGLAVGSVVTVRDGVQSSSDLLRTDSEGNTVTVPIDLGADETAATLILYGTGIRNYTNQVSVLIGSTPVPTEFVGASGNDGIDQINIVLPKILKSAGLVDVTLTADGQAANAVKVQIQ